MRKKIGRPRNSDYDTVGQVATKLGWTRDKVSYWSKEGLIEFHRKAKGRNRLYRRSDIENLKQEIASGKWDERIADYKKERPKRPGRPSKKPLISGFQIVLEPDDESTSPPGNLKVIGIQAFEICDYNEDYDPGSIPDWHHEQWIGCTFAPGEPFYERAFALHERARIRTRSPEKTKDSEPEYDPFAD